MPNAISEVAATTFDYATSMMADAATNNVPLLKIMKEAKNVQPVDGGDNIREFVLYQDNGTYQRYSGWDELNINARRVADHVLFPWRQMSYSVSINGKELLQNSGSKSRIKELFTVRLKGAEAAYTNGLGQDVHSTGTASGGKQIGGFQHLIPDTPTVGTVGGVDVSLAANAWWRSVAISGLALNGAALSATNIQNTIMALQIALTRGSDYPDVGIADANYWSLIWQSLAPAARTGPSEFTIGSKLDKPLMVNGVPIYMGGGKGSAMPSNRLYLWGSKHFKWRPHSQRNNTKINGDRYSINQDGMVQLFGTMGNMTSSNRALGGVIIP